mgnify:CR=1 FL=1
MSHEGQIHEVVLDIETYADITPEQLERMAADVEAPKNWKDPEKIAAYIERKKAEIVEKAALSPRTGKVVCVGLLFRNVGETGAEWKPWALASPDEDDLLRMVDTVLHGATITRIITFNGKRFDLPYLVARYMTHAMQTRFNLPVGHDKRHIDLWDLLGRDGSLSAWGDAILGAPKEKTGADVAAMVDAGEWDAIKAYCLDDVRMTAALYDRLCAVTGVPNA